MIKKIRNSLTVKICLLVCILLMAASGITYGAVAHFLPVYYSSQLEENLDAISREMAESISSQKSIGDAGNAIELFEAGSQVSVVILDEKGVVVWPVQDNVVEETAVDIAQIIEGEVFEEGRETVEDTETQADFGERETVEDIEAQADTEESDTIGRQEGIQEGEATELQADKKELKYEEKPGAEVTAGTVWEGNAQEEAAQGEAVQEESAQEEAYDTDATAFAAAVAQELAYEEDDLLRAGSEKSAVKHYELEIGKQKYTMFVSGGMQPVNQAMEILKRIFPFILGISLVTAVAAALAASLYLTAPVVRLSQISRKMAALDFTGTYQGNRTDEIGILGRNLNEMSANLSKTLGELHEANAKLQSDIQREREQERKRIAFFSAVSHELKTPITILKGHLSGMIQGVGDYRNRDHYLQRSRETAEKMEDMVQELLTVSRIESRAITMQKTDIAEQLRLQLAELTELIEEKNLGLTAEIPEHLLAEVNPAMMEKVFRNLLVNAIRYTPEGKGNEIRVLLKQGTAQGENVLCSVENTGVHIPEEALPHLFEAFYRVEQSRSRQTGGSGLGLYIVKMVLDQHGADYRIENTGDGVKFFWQF